MAVEVGQVAPEFSLYDQERKERSLSEFKGKNVVLAFYPGAFTGTCTSEMCAFRDRADQLNSLNAQVLGISVDAPFAQKAWADANNLNFPNLAGLQGYVVANRAVFVLDKEGVVRHKWLASSPADEPDYKQLQEVLSQLPK